VIAVTFALPAESAAFIQLLRDRKRQGEIVLGKIDNCAIEILHTGVGETHCRQRLATLLQDRQFDLLISAGFAGALTNESQPTDLLLAKNFSTVSLENLHGVIAEWTIRLADLYTSSVMVSSIEQQRAIAAETGAAAVDMETKFIARACAKHELPLLSLRVISDSPSHPFPAPPNVLFNMAKQKTDFGKFTGFFARHPDQVPKLIQFARTIRRARHKLALALADLIRNVAL
jgi:purine-nucleoside phosphorylase